MQVYNNMPVIENEDAQGEDEEMSSSSSDDDDVVDGVGNHDDDDDPKVRREHNLAKTTTCLRPGCSKSFVLLWTDLT